MRANNWQNGAKLMEKWFASSANNIPRIGKASTDIITMNWVLSYYRAKRVYSQLVKEKVWMNEAAKKEIVLNLKKRHLLTSVHPRL